MFALLSWFSELAFWAFFVVGVVVVAGLVNVVGIVVVAGLVVIVDIVVDLVVDLVADIAVGVIFFVNPTLLKLLTVTPRAGLGNIGAYLL